MNIISSSSKDTADEKPETRDQLQHPPPNAIASARASGEAATALVETRPSSSDHSNLANPHPAAAPTPSKVQFSEGFRLQSGADDAVVTQFGLDDKHQIQNANNHTDLPVSQTNCSSMPLLSKSDEEEGSASSGTEEEQSAFVNELANFFREKNIEFKHPKFYGDELNCLKLWRTVTRLGGYDKVTSCKMWRHVGDSFKPPKTCTTVSWTFRGFYEKALLDYERHKACGGDLYVPARLHPESLDVDNQASGSGRAIRDSAARAMRGWHSPGTGEVSDPANKDSKSTSSQTREKQVKGLLKRKKSDNTEVVVRPSHNKAYKLLEVEVIDIGTPAEWVKITAQETKECYEVYALVPGLLREEVRVQSDPAGRLVISGEPQNPDNPWGVRPFKKVVNLPSKIDPCLTSAMVTLHGQLLVRAPFDQHTS